jgi:hypothetical protein
MNSTVKTLQGAEAVEPRREISDSEAQRQARIRLQRLARDCESLRDMRALLDRIYGKSRRTR